jgi:hypothetical protein
MTATDLTIGQAARPGNAAHRATPDITALMHRAELSRSTMTRSAGLPPRVCRGRS